MARRRDKGDVAWCVRGRKKPIAWSSTAISNEIDMYCSRYGKPLGEGNHPQHILDALNWHKLHGWYVSPESFEIARKLVAYYTKHPERRNS